MSSGGNVPVLPGPARLVYHHRLVQHLVGKVIIFHRRGGRHLLDLPDHVHAGGNPPERRETQSIGIAHAAMIQRRLLTDGDEEQAARGGSRIHPAQGDHAVGQRAPERRQAAEDRQREAEQAEVDRAAARLGEIQRAVSEVEGWPMPDPSTLTDGVYA